MHGERRGVFFLGSAISIKDVTDGASNTVAFSERPLGGGAGIATGDPTEQASMILELPAATDPTVAACATEALGTWNHERGAKWIVGNYGNTLYNHALPPNASQWDCMNLTQQKGRLAARGVHPGGVAVLRCDGSVSFATGDVDFALWQALATRAGDDSDAS